MTEHVTNSRGLELGDMENVSGQEVSVFANFCNTVLGHRHIGLDLWLETRPDVLKRYRQYSDTATLRAYRNRYENLLRELPAEFIPASLLHYDVIRGFGEGIRENVLLLRALGASREQVVNIVGSASLNGGMAGLSIMARAAGDVLRDWGGNR
jgi:hypothetical protein